MSEKPEPDLKAISEEMAADPEIREIMERQLHEEAVKFLTLAIKTSRLIPQMEDPWQARLCMVDAMVWMREVHSRMTKEVAARKRPVQTDEAFEK